METEVHFFLVFNPRQSGPMLERGALARSAGVDDKTSARKCDAYSELVYRCTRARRSNHTPLEWKWGEPGNRGETESNEYTQGQENLFVFYDNAEGNS